MTRSLKTTYSRASALCAFLLLLLVATTAAPVSAQAGRAAQADTAGAGGAPSLRELVERGRSDSDLRVIVQRFNADRAALGRRYDIPLSPVLHARQRSFYDAWLVQLSALDAAALNASGRADLAALRDRVQEELANIARDERRFEEMAPLLPFARTLQQLQERRRDRLDIDGMEAAQTLADVLREVRRLTNELAFAEGAVPPAFRGITPDIAAGAAAFMGAPADARGPARTGGPSLKGMLDGWYSYFAGYDPIFTWWARKPYEELTTALDAYHTAILRTWPPVATQP
jgi:hypothetical protein